MSIFNWARCTTTTTGTSDLTLSSVSGYPTINDVVGVGHRFEYAIVDDSTQAPLEAGIGYLSASTTMVREKIVAKMSSGTYTGEAGAPTALSLAAGTKRVIVTALSRGMAATMPYVGSGAGFKGISNGLLIGNIGSGLYNDQDQSGRLNVFPWLHEYGGSLDAFLIYCSAAGSAGQILRMGMYRVGTDGNPAGLIFESGSIDVSSIGTKTSTFTAHALPPGYYYLALLSTSSTATYPGSQATAGSALRGPAPCGNTISDLAVAGYALSVATSAMPSTCPSITWTTNLNVPHVLLRAA